MRVKELLQLIPEEELNVLAIETQFDHQVKKLSGLIMFQLILFSMLNRKRVSLRVMEEFLRSSSFRALSNHSEIDAKYNSLSDRISMIRSEYFEKIFNSVYDKFSKYPPSQDLQSCAYLQFIPPPAGMLCVSPCAGSFSQAEAAINAQMTNGFHT